MEVMQDEYVRTEVGLVPVDWQVRPIKDLLTFIGGSQPDRSYFISDEKEGYIRLVQIRDYKGDKYITFIPSHLARRFCEADDIMIGRYGPPIFQILRGIKGAYNVALIKAVPTSIVNKEYCWYVLNQESVFNFVEKLSQRSSGQTGVDLNELRNYNIPFPPTIEEQTAIATALSDADALITSLEKLIAKKRAIKQGVMQKLLQPKEGWEVRKLGELGECIIGLTYKPSDVAENGTLVLRSSNVGDGVLKYDDNVYVNFKVNEKLINRKDDILICVRNGSRNLIGKCALIDDKAEGQTFGAFMCIYRSPFNLFIFHVFQSDIIKRQIDENIGATINQITNRNLNDFVIPFPPIEEQEKIAITLNNMDAEIAVLEKKLEKQRQLKQGMMQNLLTGKIRLV